MSHGAILASIQGFQELLPCWGGGLPPFSCTDVFFSVLPLAHLMARHAPPLCCMCICWLLGRRGVQPLHAHRRSTDSGASCQAVALQGCLTTDTCRLFEEAMLGVGAAVGYTSNDAKLLQQDLLAVRPTVFAGVPRLFDRCSPRTVLQVHLCWPRHL